LGLVALLLQMVAVVNWVLLFQSVVVAVEALTSDHFQVVPVVEVMVQV
tara:strand:+ start:269 stop:412 length:144 start_codon:yes stop_codon:yes gene_type:complete